ASAVFEASAGANEDTEDDAGVLEATASPTDDASEPTSEQDSNEGVTSEDDATPAPEDDGEETGDAVQPEEPQHQLNGGEDEPLFQAMSTGSSPVSDKGIVPIFLPGASNNGKRCIDVAPGLKELKFDNVEK